MGLFSFVKEAGEKLWDSATGKSEDQSAKLKQHLEKVGIPGADQVNIAVEDGAVTVSGEGLSQEAREKILVAAGNIAGIVTVQDHITVEQGTTEARFYTVKKGDTLSSIAKSELGSAGSYMKIFEANKPMLSHPDKIYPGQTLRIPQ